jgi:hypothetical protein
MFASVSSIVVNNTSYAVARDAEHAQRYFSSFVVRFFARRGKKRTTLNCEVPERMQAKNGVDATTV